MRTEMALLIAKTEHRLEQLTKPLFERDVVEELIKEIKLLERGDRPPLVAREIADCHNRIEELEEEVAERDEALRKALTEIDSVVAWAEQLSRQGEALRLENHNLQAQLRRLVPANEAPKLIATGDRVFDPLKLRENQHRDAKRAQEAEARVAALAPSRVVVERALDKLRARPEFGRNSPD